MEEAEKLSAKQFWNPGSVEKKVAFCAKIF